MGLFGFGKKKETKSETDKIFEQFGSATNDVKPPEKQSRKEAAALASDARVSQVKKDQLLEKLSALRKIMYTRPEFDNYISAVEDATVKLRGMADNVNKAAMSSVDNFLLGAINDAINYSNRGNYIAMGACMDIIDGFIDDRFQCGNYYTDPKFCKFKLQRNQLYVEQQNQQSAYDKLERRLAKLKADYQNPDLHLSKESIAREVTRIKEEGQRIKARLDKIDAQMSVLDKSLAEIINYSITHSNDNVFDIRDELDDILAIKRENEQDDGFTDKMNNKLDESHRKIASSSLGVNDDALDVSSAPSKLDDDFFNM